MNKRNKANTTITLDIEILDKLDRYSEKTLIPKSTFINKILKDFFKDEEVLGNF